MPRLSNIYDINTVERAPTSPAALRNKLSEMIMSSVNARAKVELFATPKPVSIGSSSRGFSTRTGPSSTRSRQALAGHELEGWW